MTQPARKLPVALEPVALGRHGEITAGQEVPATYRDVYQIERQTDYERLAALGVINPNDIPDPQESA